MNKFSNWGKSLEKTQAMGLNVCCFNIKRQPGEGGKQGFAISNQTIQSRLLPQAVASTSCSTRGKKLHRASVSHQHVLNTQSLHLMIQTCWFPSEPGAYMSMRIQIIMLFPIQAVHTEDILKVTFWTREVTYLCPSMDCHQRFPLKGQQDAESTTGYRTWRALMDTENSHMHLCVQVLLMSLLRGTQDTTYDSSCISLYFFFCKVFQQH